MSEASRHEAHLTALSVRIQVHGGRGELSIWQVSAAAQADIFSWWQCVRRGRVMGHKAFENVSFAQYCCVKNRSPETLLEPRR
ncbi:hypothetical protein P3T43_004672 [Paraburkholderia sp. GAS41]